ncbi:MAG: trypsin-like peptidase domain-containing protein [Anaerolineales bacterium]|nr:trypsin-like peptidase domain-containing protein [Anaerolineales bacterium]
MTGFLIANNLLVTGGSLTVEEAQKARIEFNFEQTFDGRDLPIDTYYLDPKDIFMVSPREGEDGDNWVVVRVKGDPNAKWGSIPLARVHPKVGDRATIIQHAGGSFKQIAFDHNVIVAVDDRRIQYLTDTLEGSGGAPVFNDNWELVAIHGGMGFAPNAERNKWRNVGIHINVVVEKLAETSLLRPELVGLPQAQEDATSLPDSDQATMVHITMGGRGRILGARSTLLPISFLDRGIALSQAVCRVMLANGGIMTGFLIANNLLVTGGSLTVEEAQKARIEFNFEQTFDGRDLPVDTYYLDPKDIFMVSPREGEDGDKSVIVRVKGDPNAKWGSIPLARVHPKVGDRATIIQHAGGTAKRIAFAHNVIVAVDDRRIQYLTDTLEGSGGAPVFNNHWELIAIHMRRQFEPNAKQNRWRNEGVHINKVIEGWSKAGVLTNNGELQPEPGEIDLVSSNLVEPLSIADIVAAGGKLSMLQKLALVDALLKVPTLQREGGRTAVVAQLRADIRSNIVHSASPRSDILNIVDTALMYSGGLDELLTLVRFFERDSVAMREIDVLLTDRKGVLTRNAAFLELQKELANIYWEKTDARRVAMGAGIRTARISFNDRSDLTWQTILERAIAEERLMALVELARAENPGVALFQKLTEAQLLEVPLPAVPDEAWEGPTESGQLEKILGAQSTLLPVNFLEKGLQLSSSVGRIVRADGRRGTGFLIANNILITSNHVLPTAEAAAKARVEFSYPQTVEDREAPVESYAFDPTAVFLTSPQDSEGGDNWTAVRVAGNPNAKWGAVTLGKANPTVGDRAIIIQHSGGGQRQIAFYHNVVVAVTERYVQYLTDTRAESSGSPVFDGNWQLIAIHHLGGSYEPNSKHNRWRNQGVHVNRVVERLIAGESLPISQNLAFNFRITADKQVLAVGELLHLQIDFIPTSMHLAPLAENIGKVYCFVDVDEGLAIHGNEGVDVEQKNGWLASVTFELQAQLIGQRSFHIEVVTRQAGSEKSNIFRSETQTVKVVAPQQAKPYEPILLPLDVRFVPQPDVVLRVETQRPQGENGDYLLTYYLSSRLPTLRLQHERVGATTLRPHDLRQLQALLQVATGANGGHDPGDSYGSMVSLGRYLYDLLFPAVTAAEFRNQYEVLAKEATSWLIVDTGLCWLPWELVVASPADTGGSVHFWGARYQMARWIEGLGPPLHREIPLGKTALTHYKALPQVRSEANETLTSWRELLLADGSITLSPLLQSEESFYSFHLLRYMEEMSHQYEIVAIDGQGEVYPTGAEEEMPQARLGLRLKRPVVTFGFVKRQGGVNGGYDGWLLPERIRPFLKAGVGAAVGPWWPTSKAADQLFWATFYDYLSQTMPLGEVVWRARLAVYEALPDRPDWLAYTLFGDPRARPYWPKSSQGYATLECVDGDEPLRPGKAYTFRASIHRQPPLWYQERLVEVEDFPEAMTVLFIAPGLQTGRPEMVLMQPMGRTTLQATVTLTPPEVGTYHLIAQLYEGDELLKTMQLLLEVGAGQNGGQHHA